MGLPDPVSPAPSVRVTRADVQEMNLDKGRSYQEVAGSTNVIIWDLDLTAYLIAKSMAPLDIWREGPEFRIVFDDPDHRVRGLHIEFLSSPEGRFAAIVKMVKKAAYSVGQRPPPRR